MSVKVGEDSVKASTLFEQGTLFADVFAWKEIEVEDTKLQLFDEQDSDIKDELLNVASADKELPLINDFACGFLGLRIHRQYVFSLLYEGVYALHSDGRVEEIYGFIAPRSLPPVITFPEQASELRQDIEQIQGMSGRGLEKFAKAMGWLRRGWVATDNITQFLAFFTAIEVILQGRSGRAAERNEKAIDAIRALIADSDHCGKQSMLSVFEELAQKQRPPLTSRFDNMAEEAKLYGWESDKVVFASMNRIRNGLIHRGEAAVELTFSVSKDETIYMEELAEKYVNWALMHDDNVHAAATLTSRLVRTGSKAPIVVQYVLPE